MQHTPNYIKVFHPRYYELCGSNHPSKAKPEKKKRLCLKCKTKPSVAGYFMCSQCQRDVQRAPKLVIETAVSIDCLS